MDVMVALGTGGQVRYLVCQWLQDVTLTKGATRVVVSVKRIDPANLLLFK